jgi:molybdopterin-containing oxidoreductase family iron-sulfur binding subunit
VNKVGSKPDLIEDRHRAVYQQLLDPQNDFVDRRSFLKLLAASIAFAGLSGCQIRQPVETIVPYVRQPEEIVLGNPLFYATAMPLSGYAMGLLVESHEGRPTKIEGNPNHPASLGATDVFAQASILDLYDPDRSQTPLYLGEIRSWGDFLTDIRYAVNKLREKQGASLRILTETITSPTLANQLQTLLTELPQAKLHQYEPVNNDNSLAGAQLTFGRPVETIYHFDKANVVLSLGSDFLMSGPGSVRYASDFMNKRRVRQNKTKTNRLYVIETTVSNTGAIADHRLAIKPSEVEGVVRLLSARLTGNSSQDVLPVYGEWVEAVVRDLQNSRGSSLVLAGRQESPLVHALVHRVNQALGNVGTTVTYRDPVVFDPTIQIQSLKQLVTDMYAGQVELLLILGGNPVFNTPVDFYFAENLKKVPLRIHHSLYYDETSAHCHWHINAAHYLESWSDARAFDGTASVIQPLIAPLFSGKTAHEMLAAFTDQPNRSSYEIVKSFWQQSAGTAAGFEQWWTKALRDGVIENTSSADLTQMAALNERPSGEITLLQEVRPPSTTPATNANVEIVFRPDPSIYDGRFANNVWLQELPKPLTKLTWDNAAIVSPRTATQLGVFVEPGYRGGEHGTNVASIVEIVITDHSIVAPVWILPGQPDGVVTLNLGYGRTRAGNQGTSTTANPVGFNAYELRRSDGLWFTTGQLRKTGDSYPLACTQAHYSMEGRDLARSAPVSEYLANPNFAKTGADQKDEQISLYPEWPYESYAWGMSIDIGSCVGCNACIVACQAENNSPVVGKSEVLHAREMHWIRIDRYFEGQPNNPDVKFQPVPCMHCEKAPCELVCPVEATTHSDEGLNEMTYNRCVGTRYCSNNCPYKVRRFNFFDYANDEVPLVKLQRNPDVTVRSRGVMEKCTYCVQRIHAAKIEAKTENRRVQDGEITPACQQACPVDAIVFGDINDPNSRVSRLKREPLDYSLLAELNTRPRTTYLAQITNPNPEMKGRNNG